MKIEYKILSAWASKKQNLSKQIEDHINYGWKLNGGLSISTSNERVVDILIAQAVTREVEV